MLLVVVVSTQSAIDVKVERRVRRRVFGDARHFRTDSNYNLGIGGRHILCVEHHIQVADIVDRFTPENRFISSIISLPERYRY